MSGRLLQLAWRNLWRTPRRTFIAMTAVAAGYAMLLSVACLMAGLRWQMIENGTRLVLSQVQVHAPDYYPSRVIQKTLGDEKGTDVDAMLATITADPRVQAAAPRVYGNALLSAGHRSAGVELLGIRPERERHITSLTHQMKRGSQVTVRMPRGVVMGEALAGLMGVDVGSELVLLTQTADGSMADAVYTVVGMFHTGFDAVDRSVVLMPLPSLQELLDLAPARIHEIGITLNDVTRATAVATALEAQLADTVPVRVRAWPELTPELLSYIQFNRGVTFVLFAIFFSLAGIGVMNTMLMAVFERTRELGMLMGLGMRRLQVIALIVVEAGGLAVVSLVAGAVAATPILWYLQTHGLDLGGATEDVLSIAGVVVGHVWYGRQDFAVYGQAGVGLAATALISALYPAWRACRFSPADAVRKG